MDLRSRLGEGPPGWNIHHLVEAQRVLDIHHWVEGQRELDTLLDEVVDRSEVQIVLREDLRGAAQTLGSAGDRAQEVPAAEVQRAVRTSCICGSTLQTHG